MMDDIEVEEIKVETKPSVSGTVSLPSHSKHIKNKQRRIEEYQKVKREKKKLQRKAREVRKKEGVKNVPHTIDSLREKDETAVGDLNSDKNAALRADLEQDEYSDYFKGLSEPKILISYSVNPSRKSRTFGRELTRMIPNSSILYRNREGVKKLVKSSIANKYTDLLIINENMNEPDGLLVIHLPEGPTAHFRISNVKTTKELGLSHKAITEHKPEVILHNFTTQLGQRVARMLGALFNQKPEFTGRRTVSFQNKWDFIFFRHYKYEFASECTRVKLKELGPRFTLKLKSVSRGTFDTKFGQYEWIMDGRRHSMETSRRKFFL